MTTSTPALVVDRATVRRNLERVARYAAGHGLAWRPHVKTHKSLAVAAMQQEVGAVGLSCATPREARVMREATDDLLLAYPPVAPGHARALGELVAGGARVGVMLDSAVAARRASDAIRDGTARVLVEVDAGMGRVGVAGVEAAIALARDVDALPGLAFDGFGFYPGHLRSAGPEVDAELARIGALVTALREAADRAGLPCHTVSAGSTPLLWRSHDIAGLTELRAGTAAYGDRTSVLGGVCDWSDCAAHVRATVVSTAVPGQAVVDAGVKALGREPMRGADAPGYAAVRGRPEVVVARLSEEHGTLDLSATDWRPVLGDVVELVPNHACVAVHNFDWMVMREGDGSEAVLPVDARGR